MGVPLAKVVESGDNLFPRQLVKLVDVLLLTPVDGQATESGSNLLGIDGGRELTRLFCPARQFVEAFQLSDQGDTVFTLPLFPQFFDQVGDQRVGFTVEQFIGMFLAESGVYPASLLPLHCCIFPRHSTERILFACW